MAATIVYMETSHKSMHHFYFVIISPHLHLGFWISSKCPSTFRTNKNKLDAYLYSFFNVVFNVADFLLFLPVKFRGRFTLFHWDNCRKYRDEALNQSLCRAIVHFILPKYCRNLCGEAFEHWCKTVSFPLQVLSPFTGFVRIHLNYREKKSSASTPSFPWKRTKWRLDFTDSLEFLRGQGWVLQKADWW